MYIVPDLLELQFTQIKQGYFSRRGFTRGDKLKLLCNWICRELTAGGRSWSSIREELQLEDDSALELHFFKTTGFLPRDFAEYWKNGRSKGRNRVRFRDLP